MNGNVSQASKASKKILWIALVSGLALSLGVVVFLLFFSGKPSTESTSPPVGGQPVSPAERERRLNLARANERKIIQALKPKAKDFGEKSTQLLSFKVKHDSRFTFSPDGTRLAIGKQGGEIEIRNLFTGEPIQVLPGNKKRVGDLAYSPVGNLLVSLGRPTIDEPPGNPKSVIFWNSETGKRRNEFWVPWAYSLAISPDGTRFLLGTRLSRNEIWQ